MPKRKHPSRSTSASGYIGVTLIPSKKYQAKIKNYGKTISLGTHNTARQAAIAHDAAAILHGKPLSKLNFPHNVPLGYTPAQSKLMSSNTSGYRGVSKTKKTKGDGYQATIYIQGKAKGLGIFSTCKQAAIAYDYAVHKHGRPLSWLNFPTMKYDKGTTKKKET